MRSSSVGDCTNLISDAMLRSIESVLRLTDAARCRSQSSDRGGGMQTRFVRSFSVVAACAVTVLAVAVFMGPRAQAANDDNDESKVRRGFETAPVPLNLAGKNRALVGLGSYIVNNVGECNGCHSQGPQTEFNPGGNPFFGQPEQVNQATYLGGGRNFGAFPTTGGGTVDIVSRNLTPDGSGLPIGGDTFEEFRNTIRTGHDPDQVLYQPGAAIPRRSVGHAVAGIPQHDGPRPACDLNEDPAGAVPCVATAGHSCT